MIGTGSQRNFPHLEVLGATATTYGPGLADRVAELAPQGIDAALHLAPSSSLPDLVAIAGDAVITVSDSKGGYALGVQLVYVPNDSAVLRRAARFGRAGASTPRVDAVMRIAEVAQAHSPSAAAARWS